MSSDKQIIEALDEMRARRELATPGPWRNSPGNPMIHGAKSKGDVARASEVFMNKTQRINNAEFIAASRTEHAKLEAALRLAIEALDIAKLGETQFDGVEAMHAARKALESIAGVLRGE